MIFEHFLKTLYITISFSISMQNDFAFYRIYLYNISGIHHPVFEHIKEVSDSYALCAHPHIR